MEQALSDWVYGVALERIERSFQLARRTGRGMNQGQYQAFLCRLADNHSAGRYAWEGDLLNQALDQLPGNKQIVLLRFQRYDPEVTMELIEDIFDSDSLRKLGMLINPLPADGEKKEEKQDQAPAADPS